MSINTTANTLCKQPFEKRQYFMDFSNLLITGDTIVTASGIRISDTKMDGSSSDLSISSSGIDTTSKIVGFFIDGGTHANRYRIEVQIHTASGHKLEGDGILLVSDR